jgi:hypothetical protein
MLGYGDLFVNFFCAFHVRLDLFNLIQTQSILDISDLPSIYNFKLLNTDRMIFKR